MTIAAAAVVAVHATLALVRLKERAMKITKRQLRRIIREEKAKVLAEQKLRRIVRRRLLEMPTKAGFHMEDAVLTMGYPHKPEEYDDSIELAADYFGDKWAAEHVHKDLKKITSKGFMPDETLKAYEDSLAAFPSLERRGDWKAMLAMMDPYLKKANEPYKPASWVLKGLAEKMPEKYDSSGSKIVSENRIRQVVRQLLEVKYLANDVVEYEDGHEVMAALNMKRVNTKPDEYDDSIELYASIFGDDEAVKKVALDFGRLPDDVLSPANLKWQQGLIRDYKSGKIKGTRDWRGLLKSVPEDLKRKVFPYKPSRDVRKKHGLGEFAKEA